MLTTLAISQYINSLAEVRERFAAIRAIDARFFTEWYEDLPELTEPEKEHCDRIKERYLYHRDRGNIGEGLVNQIAIALHLNYPILCPQSILCQIAQKSLPKYLQILINSRLVVALTRRSHC